MMTRARALTNEQIAALPELLRRHNGNHASVAREMNTTRETIRRYAQRVRAAEVSAVVLPGAPAAPTVEDLRRQKVIQVADTLILRAADLVKGSIRPDELVQVGKALLALSRELDPRRTPFIAVDARTVNVGAAADPDALVRAGRLLLAAGVLDEKSFNTLANNRYDAKDRSSSGEDSKK